MYWKKEQIILFKEIDGKNIEEMKEIFYLKDMQKEHRNGKKRFMAKILMKRRKYLNIPIRYQRKEQII